ncbi:MAG: hypothetical protein HYS12_27325 [Planctomycetes bacterium]|nr:hypothetical protein [Planctomycetota bacterium]
MFRCQLCDCVVPAGTTAHRLVLATRPRKYPFRRDANCIVRLNEKGKRKEKFIDDPGGAGYESAREVLACPACAARHNGH